MAIFPVGIPYSRQKPKNPYRWGFSLRVATLNLKRTFEDSLACYCYTIKNKVNSGTMRSPVSQPAFAGK